MTTKTHEITIALGLLLSLAIEYLVLAAIVVSYGILAIYGGVNE